MSLMGYRLANWILMLELTQCLAASSGSRFYRVREKAILDGNDKAYLIHGIGLGTLHSFTEDDFRGAAGIGARRHGEECNTH